MYRNEYKRKIDEENILLCLMHYLLTYLGKKNIRYLEKGLLVSKKKLCNICMNFVPFHNVVQRKMSIFLVNVLTSIFSAGNEAEYSPLFSLSSS